MAGVNFVAFVLIMILYPIGKLAYPIYVNMDYVEI